MKKFYSLCVLLCVIGASSCLISSCFSDDEGDTPPALPGNSFVFGDTEHKIESVVYTVDEQKLYSFYFSPTPGLVDLDAMLLADDYLKITTTTPTGEIDLLAANNSLEYDSINVSAATGDNVSKAVMSLQLTSLNTAKMNLDVAMKSGETFLAGYNGTCVRQETKTEEGYDVTLTNRIFGFYLGKLKEQGGISKYKIVLTNATWDAFGQEYNLTSEGYVLELVFFGVSDENWKNMPTGVFFDNDNKADHTFDSESSSVLYRDKSGRMSRFTLLDPVKIVREDADNVTVTASFIDKNYEEHTLVYTGGLKISNGTLNVKLPQTERDLVIDGAMAQGVYSGDVAQNGTGLSEITIYDRTAANNEPGGCAIKLSVFAEKFTNPKVDRRLIPGTYKAATTYAQFTWMQPSEAEIMGMVIPLGSYALYDNGEPQGEYSYPISGDIVIRQGSDKTHYTVEFDLQSLAGYSIKGAYTGEIYLEDQSNDSENDGTSNLKGDYEFNMDYLPRGKCFPRDEIWVRGLGDISVEEACERAGREFGFQYLQFGDEGGTWEITEEYPLGGGWNGKGKGKLIEGDILGIDLLVKKGTEHQITPGTYQITANRYPGYFYPGVCVSGYSCYYGTSMMRVVSAVGWGYVNGYYDPEYMVENGWLNIPVLGKFASIYSGTVTVEKAEGGDNWYRFTVDGRDVLKHRITGSWTGPIYLGNSETPVLESDAATVAAMRKHLPSFREVQSRNGGRLPRFMFTDQQFNR